VAVKNQMQGKHCGSTMFVNKGSTMFVNKGSTMFVNKGSNKFVNKGSNMFVNKDNFDDARRLPLLSANVWVKR
jgi:hypothetical protein